MGTKPKKQKGDSLVETLLKGKSLVDPAAKVIPDNAPASKDKDEKKGG